MRKEFSEQVSMFYWKPVFWHNSYWVISCVGAPLEMVKQYIRGQENTGYLHNWEPQIRFREGVDCDYRSWQSVIGDRIPVFLLSLGCTPVRFCLKRSFSVLLPSHCKAIYHQLPHSLFPIAPNPLQGPESSPLPTQTLDILLVGRE